MQVVPELVFLFLFMCFFFLFPFYNDVYATRTFVVFCLFVCLSLDLILSFNVKVYLFAFVIVAIRYYYANKKTKCKHLAIKYSNYQYIC